MIFKVYTDGSCSSNPGAGGYAFVVVSPRDNALLKLSGCSPMTTNNQMELKAIVSALKHLQDNFAINARENIIQIHSDSAYCVNPLVQGWLKNWKRFDWKTRKGEEIKNLELWKELDRVLDRMRAKVEFIKVKGHAGDEYNELANDLAQNATKRALERLKRQESEAANVSIK